MLVLEVVHLQCVESFRKDGRREHRRRRGGIQKTARGKQNEGESSVSTRARREAGRQLLEIKKKGWRREGERTGKPNRSLILREDPKGRSSRPRL